MASHNIDGRSESADWISLEMVAGEKSVDPTPFEKFLGLAPSFQVAGAEITSFNHQQYVEDVITELMEEDVWGQDDGMSSFDGSTTPSSQPWPDSESDSYFSASHDEGGVRRIRFAGIFSPSQFSPISMNDREAMGCRQIHSLQFMASEYVALQSVNGAQHIVDSSTSNGRLLLNESFSPGNGPKSAPIDVPLWSKFCTQVDADVEEEEEDGISNTGKVPPHKLLAKQIERRRMSAFSVIEGAGRTLKGRDASEVRDAVWKQTGFPG